MREWSEKRERVETAWRQEISGGGGKNVSRQLVKEEVEEWSQEGNLKEDMQGVVGE